MTYNVFGEMLNLAQLMLNPNRSAWSGGRQLPDAVLHP